jgi:hypothetical protein
LKECHATPCAALMSGYARYSQGGPTKNILTEPLKIAPIMKAVR